MEEFYRLNPVISCTNEVVGIENVNSSVVPSSIFQNNSVSDQNGVCFRFETEIMEPDMSDLIKTQIANHPRYPDLVAAYIECQKVGAPPEAASHLEEISRDNFSVSSCSEFGVDPELDDFMESYCEILHRYKEELSKPFNEATAFLSSIESEFCKLCSESSTKTLDYHSADQAAAAEEEEYISSCGEVEVSESDDQDNSLGVRSGDQELKEMLLRKYSGYLNSLRKEFLHKRKKGKLPKDATTSLMDWWSSHYRWPYPTEEEKQKLSEETGLDQKQINNWFINQRKRHWKPSEEMRTALTQSVRNAINGGGGGAAAAAGPFYFDTGVGSDHHDF